MGSYCNGQAPGAAADCGGRLWRSHVSAHLSLCPNRRKTSFNPPANPSPPRTNVKINFVCSQRSKKYPSTPPNSTAPTIVNGNSIASAVCEEYFFTFTISGDFGSLLFVLSSKAI